MKKNEQNKPSLIFFRDTPKDLLEQHPLASSLQNLETSFLLIALRRYPDSLVVLGSAIESALKAAIKASPDDFYNFHTLIQEAQKIHPDFTNISNQDRYEFRKKRNDITHYGFSPKDDEESAILLLKTGYPLIEQCYKAFFQFDLLGSDNNYGGLLKEFAYHLTIAKKVYLKAKEVKDIDLTYCFRSFAHLIRWNTQHWMMSDWQKNLLNMEWESGMESFEFKEKQRKELKWKILKNPWEFECPICGESDSFICDLDITKLENGEISLINGACVECSFVIPKGAPFLAVELCSNQFEDAKPKIFKEYGIQ